MKSRMLGCIVCLIVCCCFALRDVQLSSGFHFLSDAEESTITAGQEGYYCGAGTGNCETSGAAPSPGDAVSYWCTKIQDGTDCSTTWCPGGSENQECLPVTWGFQWLYSCTKRTQGCEKRVAVCRQIQGSVYACDGARTHSYTGCGTRVVCD